MIYVDTKEKAQKRGPDKGSFLIDEIRKCGLPCLPQALPFGDAAFSGHGPEGGCDIGVERKRVQDMLDCIESARLTGHQLPGMRDQYRFRFVMMEGFWRRDPGNGNLLEGHPKPNGGMYWSEARPGRRRPVPYSTLRRYLFSLSLLVPVLYTRDIGHTARDISELYAYFQKPWKEHRSGLQLPEGYDLGGSLSILPTLGGKPSLARRWAAELPGIGVTLSDAVARRMPRPFDIAMASDDEWLEVPGIGEKTARDIVREIMGE